MTFRYDDRVKVTISSALGATGPIPYNSPAPTGFIPFTSISGITTGDVVPYEIVDGAGNWESGYGTWTAGTGLARPSTVSRNSAGTTARINFTGATTAWVSSHTATLALLDNNGWATFGGQQYYQLSGQNIFVKNNLSIAGASLGGNALAVNGNAAIDGALDVNGIVLEDTAGVSWGAGGTVIEGESTSYLTCIVNANGVTLTTNSTAWVPVTSRRRSKTDFEVVPHPLETISKHRFVFYRYKTDPKSQRKHIGVTHEEAEKFFPQGSINQPPSIITDKKTGKKIRTKAIKSVNPDAYAFLACAGVDELRKIVQQQAKQIARLEKIIKR